MEEHPNVEILKETVYVWTCPDCQEVNEDWENPVEYMNYCQCMICGKEYTPVAG